MRRIVFLLAVNGALLADGVAAEALRFVRREVAWGEPVSLVEFGGPAVEVAVRSRQVSFVSVDIADFTRMVPVLVNDATIYGPSRVVMQPTRATRRIEKKDGVPVPGGRAEMFLLYLEPRSGIEVYFSDEATAQNRDVLVIGVPHTRKRAPERLPAPRPREEPARKADGYLSDKLLEWYLRLEEKRQRLNVNDVEAVRLFNEEAARYHEEVKRERGRSAAQ